MTVDSEVVERCDEHGEYTAKTRFIELIGRSVSTGCPACAESRRAADEAEQARQREEYRAALLRKCGVPLRFVDKTLDTYVATHDKQQLALAAAKRLVTAMQTKPRAAPNLIMIGKPGTGKSHLSCGIINALCATHKVCRVDLPDLIREIRATWSKTSPASEEAILNHYGSLDLLIIEEVGTGSGTDDERARIFQVVNRRYEAMLPTVIVSNLDMESLKAEIGERVIDRLREGNRSLVIFDWQSHRGAA